MVKNDVRCVSLISYTRSHFEVAKVLGPTELHFKMSCLGYIIVTATTALLLK